MLGYLISIAGKIRVGKTTLMSGLSHIFQLINISDLNENIDNVKENLYSLNFNYVNEIIENEIFLNNKNFDNITEKIINIFNLNKNTLIYNFLDFKNIKELLLKYVESYYILNFRNQFVISKTMFYSHLTNNTNLILDLEMTKIKDAFKNKNYAISNYFIELIDESSDDFGAGNQYKDTKDESGAREYRRKYGHIHKETNRLITIKQDSTDEFARLRKLTQSNIQIQEKVKVIGKFPIFNYIIKKMKSFILNFNIIRFYILALFKGLLKKADIQLFIDFKLNESYPGKRLIHKLSFIQSYLFSKSYCKFNTKIYEDEEDVGKENNNSKTYYQDFTFIIPTNYCFGCFNTHEYSYIQDELINNSNITIDDLEESLLFISKDKKYFKVEEVSGGSYYED